MQGLGDSLPAPGGANQEVEQRERPAPVLGGELIGQRGGRVTPPVGGRPQRHASRVADQVAAVTGLSQNESRLAALDPEPGRVVSSVRVHLGVHALVVLGAGRGLRAIQQRERNLGGGHSSILTSSPLTRR